MPPCEATEINPTVYISTIPSPTLSLKIKESFLSGLTKRLNSNPTNLRLESALSHWLIQKLISRTYPAESAEVGITKAESGRPELRGISNLFISISHSSERITVALSSYPVGIDAESLKTIDEHYVEILPALKLSFQEHLKSFPPAKRPEVFALFWTGMESSLKLLDKSLEESLVDFTPQFDPSASLPKSGELIKWNYSGIEFSTMCYESCQVVTIACDQAFDLVEIDFTNDFEDLVKEFD